MMLAKEFNLPQEVIDVLPSDPFQQLDLARKITSIALSTRVSSLISESAVLRQQLADRDAVIVDLNSQLESIDSTVSANLRQLSIANQENGSLLKENAGLLKTVNNLKRDVAKLESFRKTLMMSLQDVEGSSATDPAVAANAQNHTSVLSQTFSGEDEGNSASTKSQSSDVGNSYHGEPVNDGETQSWRPRISPSLLFASQTSTPQLTSPGSRPTLSASASPTRTLEPVSPRRHSISVSSSVFSSANSSTYSSMSGGTRVDGKEFFRQVRRRLSYEQFSAFLANVKELNSQKQSKEVTLQKAEEIFGPGNNDLYAIFEGLVTHNFN